MNSSVLDKKVIQWKILKTRIKGRRIIKAGSRGEEKRNKERKGKAR